MSVLCILRGGHLEAVNHWSRHATPRAFCHVLLNGPSGAGVYRAFDEDAIVAAGLDNQISIFGHPTLGDPAVVVANARNPDGSLLHVYNWADVPDPMSVEAFLMLRDIELYLPGHIEGYLNIWSNRVDEGDGEITRRRAVGLRLSDASWIDGIRPSFLSWRDDQQTSQEIPDDFRSTPGGALRYRAADMVVPPVIQYAEAETP
jgi:hypothetical protein